MLGSSGNVTMNGLIAIRTLKWSVSSIPFILKLVLVFKDILHWFRGSEILYMPGAMTPTEVYKSYHQMLFYLFLLHYFGSVIICTLKLSLYCMLMQVVNCRFFLHITLEQKPSRFTFLFAFSPIFMCKTFCLFRVYFNFQQIMDSL